MEGLANLSSSMSQLMSFLTSSLEPNKTLGLVISSSVGQLVILGVSCFLLIGVGLKRRAKWEADAANGAQNVERSGQVKSVEDIPRHYHYSHGLMPTIVEGLASLHQFRNDGVKALERWACQYGPIFEIAFLTGKIFVVNDPSLIQKILGSTDFHVQNKPRFLYDHCLREWMRYGLIGSEKEIWASHRKMVARTVHYKALPGYLKMMNKHAKSLVSELLSECSNGGIEGDLVPDLMYSHSIKIISEILLGVESSSEKESKEFHRHFKQSKILMLYRFLNPVNLIPIVWWFNPKRKLYDHHVSKVKSYVTKDIEKIKSEAELERKGREGREDPLESEAVEGIKPFRSLIHEMVHYNAKDNEIYDEVGTFLSAGQETNVVVMNFFMQHLAENPEIQLKCHEELDTLFRAKQKLNEIYSFEDLTMEDLSNLKYLERCILETLRITPAVPLYHRQLSAPMQFGDFKFKEGATFAFMPWVVHRDPKNYPNPTKFDPDRFLPENVKKRNPFAFIPFALGPRACLGAKLATMEMKVILAWLLRHFDIHSEDRLEDIKIHVEITAVMDRNFKIRLTKRKHTGTCITENYK